MSSGTTSAIRGGMAYVEAYLDDNPLTRGLAKLQGKLKGWQASLSRAGAGAYGGELPAPFGAIVKFAASPAGAFTALLGTAKMAAASRDEMLRMSETTGLAVEKLSALSYAARRAGVDNATLAAGLRKMQGKEFLMALGDGKANILPGLGLDAHKGDAADQFRAIVQQFEKLDAVSRVGLAKKLGITELLPLINQGVASLDAFTARAKQLGMVMSEDDAKAGKQFELAMGDLQDVLKASAKSLGGAIIPLVTGLTNAVVPVVVGIRDWLKAHQALTVGLFAGTGAIVAGGIAVKGLAVVAGIAANVVGGLRAVVQGIGMAASVVLAPVRILANGGITVLSGAVGLATKALSIAGSFISGAFSAGIWAMQGVVGIATGAWHLFSAAMTFAKTVMAGISAAGALVVNVVTAIGAAIATLISMGPLLLAAVPLALVAGWFAIRGAVYAAGVAAEKVKGSLSSAAAAASQAMGTVATKAGEVKADVIAYGETVRNFGIGIASSVSGIFSRLWSDVRAGFDNLKGDVAGAWETIQSLLANGKFAEAFALGVAIMKLEWIRFRNWFADTWNDLIPTFNHALKTVSEKLGNFVGGAMANLKMTWGNIWDFILSGLKKVLTSIDSAIAGVYRFIDRVHLEIANLTGKMLAARSPKDRRFSLADMVPDARSEYGKAVDDRAAEAQGAALADRITQGIGGLVQNPDDAADRARRAADLQQALFGKQVALADAQRAAAAAEAAAKEKNRDKFQNAEGHGVMGTFSGAAAGMLGGAGNPMVAIGNQQLAAANAQADRLNKAIEVLKGINDAFLGFGGEVKKLNLVQ